MLKKHKAEADAIAIAEIVNALDAVLEEIFHPNGIAQIVRIDQTDQGEQKANLLTVIGLPVVAKRIEINNRINAVAIENRPAQNEEALELRAMEVKVLSQENAEETDNINSSLIKHPPTGMFVILSGMIFSIKRSYCYYFCKKVQLQVFFRQIA